VWDHFQQSLKKFQSDGVIPYIMNVGYFIEKSHRSIKYLQNFYPSSSDYSFWNRIYDRKKEDPKIDEESYAAIYSIEQQKPPKQYLKLLNINFMVQLCHVNQAADKGIKKIPLNAFTDSGCWTLPKTNDRNHTQNILNVTY